MRNYPRSMIRFRTLYGHFVEGDEALVSAVLRELWPSATFYARIPYSASRSPEPPAVGFHPSIEACGGHWIEGWLVSRPVEPHWRFGQQSWVLQAVYPGLSYERSRPLKTSPGLERVGITQMTFRCRVIEPSDLAMVQRAVRQIRKFCAREVTMVEQPSLCVLDEDSRTDAWIGPHAMEWLRAAPGRILSDGVSSRGYRPRD